MGIRVATSFSARQFNLLITNVPGAQSQMYVAGTKLLETYAVPPLLHNQVLAIGVTSYSGMLYFGINADRDAMSDVDVLPDAAARIARRIARGRAVSSLRHYDSPMSKGKAGEGRRSARSQARSPTRSTKPNCSGCKRNS